jgi:signal transduction histidine kinase
MDELSLQFFPYPHVFRKERRQGVLVQWPDRCSGCDRQCEKAAVGPPQLCSYGVNYQRVSNEMLIAGIALSDYGAHTDARQKVLKAVGKASIRRSDLEKVVQQCHATTDQLEREMHEHKDKVIAEYRQSKGYQTEIVELLRPHLETTLAQVHDYKQFVQQIIQNLDVYLDSKTPGLPIEQKVEQATHEEAAIYWAARLMDEKIDAALFVLYPERVIASDARRRIRFHGLVSKYEKIYRRTIESQKLRIRTIGESWAEIEVNPRAIAIIPHALIDNAIKYAPEGTDVTLHFRDSDTQIIFGVESFGPIIQISEIDRIFELFFRAHAAERVSSEGTGFGLGAAQYIATTIGTKITVTQDGDRGPQDTRRTIFEVRLDRAPTDAQVSARGTRHRAPRLRSS